MPDIFHDFPIDASAQSVFDAISTPPGLDRWWTARSKGTPRVGSEYELWFGPEYDWRAIVTLSRPDEQFELEMHCADVDWNRTRIGFKLMGSGSRTQISFYHVGWPELNSHYRISSYCWAMYLRILKRFLEFGESVPYEQRLSV